MVFDPMKFYDDGQRRQKRYDSLVPVFVVALVVLVVFGAAFVAYQRSHVKPKPVAPALVVPKPMHDTEVTCSGDVSGSDEGCNTWRNQTAGCISQVNGPVRCPGTDGQYTPVDGKDVLEGFNQTHKHKRKTVCVAVNEYIDGLGDSDFWMIPGTMIWFPTHRECNKFWANPIPLWAGAHPIVWNKPYCLPGGSVKGDIPPCGEGTWYYRSHAPEISPEGGICDLGECGYSDHPTLPVGAPVQYWTTGGTKRVPDWRIIKNPDGTCEREETWPDIGSGGRTERIPIACQKPDCKMPADVDVCPTQMLESKGISDEGVDLKKYGVRDGKAKP